MVERGAGALIGAIDVGGTKIVVGVADRAGKLLASDRFPTLPERGPDAVVGEALARLNALVFQQGEALAAVGVGCAGPLDLEQGLVLSPPNLPGWERVPLKAKLESALGVPVRVDNDANAAALAEFRLGAGRGCHSMVYATISTGIGGGVIVNGQLLHGVGGGAGELGHQTIRPEGPLCGCGNRGCLEAIASGTAIVARARAAGFKAEHAGEVAASSDPIAVEIWREAIQALAIGLGNVVAILAPQRVILGGGVSQAGDLLLVPLREEMARRVRMLPFDQVEIRLAEHVNDAGLYGAIALGLI